MPFLPENLLEPISEQNPCGEPASVQKNYEKLRDSRRPNEAALEAFMSPRGNGPPRAMSAEIWAPKEANRVVEMIVGMLTLRGKDLELAVWLAETLLWRNGLPGFLEGLALVRGLLDRYWDQLHPLPDEGDYYMRVRHLEWIGMTESIKDSSPPLAIGFIAVTQNGKTLNECVDARGVPLEANADSSTAQEKRREAADAGKMMPEEFYQAFDATPKAFYKDLKVNVAACRKTIDELDEFCREKFSDPPGFTKIRAVLEKAESEVLILLRLKLEKDPDPVELAQLDGLGGEVAAGSTRVFTAVSAAAFDEMVAVIGEVSGLEPANSTEAIVRIAVAARALRRQSPSNPMPYLLMRGLRWGELFSAGRDLPLASLSAPSTEIRTNLKQLAASGAWPQVLELCESAMATECGRAWLDLQRYAVRACEELGYEGAGRAIRLGVKHLLEDYPALATATLLDDTGAANPETAAWLAAIAQQTD